MLPYSLSYNSARILGLFMIIHYSLVLHHPSYLQQFFSIRYSTFFMFSLPVQVFQNKHLLLTHHLYRLLSFYHSHQLNYCPYIHSYHNYSNYICGCLNYFLLFIITIIIIIKLIINLSVLDIQIFICISINVIFILTFVAAFYIRYNTCSHQQNYHFILTVIFIMINHNHNNYFTTNTIQ